MARLRDIEIPFEKVVALVHGLSPAEKRRLLMEISSDEAYWKDLYTFSRKLAKRRGFARMTERQLENLLHRG